MSVEPRRSEIAVYHDQPLEVFKPRSLVLPDSPAAKRFFLPSDVVVGRYGVVGYILADSRPENRFVTYTDGDWIGVTHRKEDFKDSYPDKDPSHYLDTDTGLKMIRYFALPPSVRSFFERDKFLGDPLIDKCCSEGTLPENFDEEPSTWHWAFWGADKDEVREVTDSVVLGTNPNLTRKDLKDWQNSWRENIYLSFHPWRDMEHVLKTGTESIYAAIANFDSILERFDIKRVLAPRDLLIQGQSDFLQLPPATT